MKVAVSAVIFSLHNDLDAEPAAVDTDGKPDLWLPLVRRTRSPYEGSWALPGGWVNNDESLSEAAARTLDETTRLRPSYLEQLYTFGHPDRSPGDRVISTIYTALVRADEAMRAEEGENVRWFRASEVPQLAFDHNQIVEYALWRLRNKVEYAHVAFHFLGETFSLSQLREVYEVILQKRLDPANFRRHVEATGAIVPTTEHLTGGRHRPPRLYRTNHRPDPTSVGPLA